jgi:hypothetical protein
MDPAIREENHRITIYRVVCFSGDDNRSPWVGAAAMHRLGGEGKTNILDCLIATNGYGAQTLAGLVRTILGKDSQFFELISTGSGEKFYNSIMGLEADPVDGGGHIYRGTVKLTGEFSLSRKPLYVADAYQYKIFKIKDWSPRDYTEVRDKLTEKGLLVYDVDRDAIDEMLEDVDSEDKTINAILNEYNFLEMGHSSHPRLKVNFRRKNH